MRDSETWEKFVDAVNQQDTHKKLKAAEEIISYISDRENSVEFAGVDKLIDGLLAWASSSNFRISQYGLEILGILAERLRGSFKGFLTNVTPVIADRLGDSKVQVRVQAHNVLMKLMDPVSSPQVVFELLTAKFSHKNWRVREELMLCMVKTIETFGASSLQINRQMPAICKLLSDPTSQVRETALNTVVVVYRHVGEKVRIDLSRRGIPAGRLTAIFAKFDECLNSGNMVVDAVSNSQAAEKVNGDVEKPKPAKSSSIRRSTSFSNPKRTSVMDRGAGSSGSSSGAVDECDFVSQWEEHVDIRVYSNKEITEELNKINSTLSNASNAWEQRVAALKRLRGLVKQFGDYEQVPKLLRELEESLKISVKDLRSQITKEVCVTLSYFASRYGRDFDFLAEAVMPVLLVLIANTVKVMASSGNAAIRLILKHTHNPRLIPSFVSNLLTNKSKEIRRRCAEYIDLILETWETNNIKGNVTLLEEAIRKGIADADSEARAAMRRAYWHFADHYKNRADHLMETFDSTKQKLLQSDKNLLQAGVTRPASSLKSYKTTTKKKSARSASASAADVEDRSIMPPPRKPVNREPARLPANMQRSASQLEGRMVRTPQMEPRQKSCDEFFRSANGASNRMRQGKRPVASQPSSRSASPTRRMPSFSRERSEDYMKRVSPMKTRIPTPRKSSTSQSTSRSNSRAGSRDSSPVRMTRGSGNSVPVADLRNRHNGASSNSKYVTEDELWNAYERSPGHRRYDSVNNNMHHRQPSSDEESEGSSISSERSNSAYNMKQGPVTQDVNEIIKLLGSQSWSDNRDGMTSLQVYLQGTKKLSLEETLRLRDVCNKFFSDPHIKVYRIFLDVLSEFIIQCRVHLNDWIFILLTRLLHKIGSDILPSLNSKVARVLDIVRDSFPYDQQFQILTKYITDNTQTPTLKMKIAILHYMQGLIKLMDSSDFANTGATRLAVSRIITWTSEPKSAEVRKEAAAVIVALFELNTPVFSTMLAVLPNSFQDGATKLLHNHLRPLANRVAATPKPVPEYNVEYEDYSSKYASPVSKGQTRLGYRSISPTKHQNVVPDYDTTDSGGTFNPGRDQSPVYYDRLSGGRPDVRDGAEAGDALNYAKTAPLKSRLNFSGEDLEDSPEVRSHEPRGQENDLDSQKKGDNQHGKGYHMTPTSHKTANDSSFLLSSATPPHYDPKQYQDMSSSKVDDKTMLSPEMVRVADGAEEPDNPAEPPSPANLGMMNQITAVLSAPRNESGSEDVKGALIELIKLARTGAREHAPKIKNLMPIVTETLQHTEGAIRCLAARAIREVIRSLPEAYKDDIRHVILGLIETQADLLKEVSKTAEECCNLIAENETTKDIMHLLCPMIETVQFPSVLAAIKMLNIAIEHAQVSEVMPLLEGVTTSLLKSYDHSESTVRKASVFCLVSLNNLVGQDILTPYLQVLNGSKLKLLNLYIKRSQASQ